MPRKSRGIHTPSTSARTRFNEAAARCRGKVKAEVDNMPTTTLASMRPRPDAAEKGGGRVRSITVSTLQ